MNPRLGIFWLLRRRIIAFTEAADAVKAVGGTKDSDLAHSRLWPSVVESHPELRGREYWSIPRGRVLYHLPKRVYVIYSSGAIIKSRRNVEKIIRRFELPPDQVALGTDIHYERPSDDLLSD